VSFAPLSREAELHLFRSYCEQGCFKARDALVSSQIPLAKKHIAGQCRGNRRMLDDLMPDAALAAYEAVERFDPSRGARLSTTIRFAVMDLCKKWRQNRTVIKIPQSAARKPYHTEQSLYAADGRLREDCNPASSTDLAVDETDTRLAEISSAMVYLPPKLRAILHRRFWQQETLQHIGDELGVTKQRVRQLQIQAISELKSLMGQIPCLSLSVGPGTKSATSSRGEDGERAPNALAFPSPSIERSTALQARRLGRAS
jgi:RNA polymerase sigma factor (sigma-70 family)